VQYSPTHPEEPPDPPFGRHSAFTDGAPLLASLGALVPGGPQCNRPPPQIFALISFITL